ncbi:hypothetical protein [Paenibacillus silvestris]|uniref:hypothetical protein n=1 Tax=Paenibacillus silvestris TaxID=2606219 RepID=UPI00137307C3|nr:hypothetical protein [Paenibacillus silvestris]
MIVQWTETARNRFRQIKSDHYSEQETIDYKIELLRQVEQKVVSMGTMMPSREYRNTYYCIADRFIVS